MESGASGLYERFWITDEPTGLFCWTPLEALPDDTGIFDLNKSGICSLEVEGDSLIDSPYSSVLFYDSGDIFYCSEVFQGSTDVFCMQARKMS